MNSADKNSNAATLMSRVTCVPKAAIYFESDKFGPAKIVLRDYKCDFETKDGKIQSIIGFKRINGDFKESENVLMSKNVYCGYAAHLKKAELFCYKDADKLKNALDEMSKIDYQVFFV